MIVPVTVVLVMAVLVVMIVLVLVVMMVIVIVIVIGVVAPLRVAEVTHRRPFSCGGRRFHVTFTYVQVTI